MHCIASHRFAFTKEVDALLCYAMRCLPLGIFRFVLHGLMALSIISHAQFPAPTPRLCAIRLLFSPRLIVFYSGAASLV